jgi:FHA domain
VTHTDDDHVSQKVIADAVSGVGADFPDDPAVLVVKRGPNAGSRFPLDQPVTSAGRHPGSDIFLDDVTVSRRHAEFRREGGGEGLGLTAVEWATAVLNNGVGNYPKAVAAALQASEFVWELLVPPWAVVELIEAGPCAADASIWQLMPSGGWSKSLAPAAATGRAASRRVRAPC